MQCEIERVVQAAIRRHADGEIDLGPLSSLREIGLNSISFIRVIIDIEEEAGIRFEDEKLRVEGFVTVGVLTKYVQDAIARQGA
jgi:acyl carrier protein